MEQIQNDAIVVGPVTSQIIDRISKPSPAGESRTQDPEDWNNNDRGNGRRVSRGYSVLVICSIMVLI